MTISEGARVWFARFVPTHRGGCRPGESGITRQVSGGACDVLDDAGRLLVCRCPLEALAADQAVAVAQQMLETLDDSAIAELRTTRSRQVTICPAIREGQRK